MNRAEFEHKRRVARVVDACIRHPQHVTWKDGDYRNKLPLAVCNEAWDALYPVLAAQQPWMFRADSNPLDYWSFKRWPRLPSMRALRLDPRRLPR